MRLYTVHKGLSGITPKLHHNVTFPNAHVALSMPEDISDTIPLQFSKYSTKINTDCQLVYLSWQSNLPAEWLLIPSKSISQTVLVISVLT